MKNNFKTNNNTSSQTNSNISPFPKLKPRGSLNINQLPNKNENNNNISQNNTSNSFESKKENTFLSRLRIFEPKANNNNNNKNDNDINMIRHSKTLRPSFLDNLFNKENQDNKDNKDKKENKINKDNKDKKNNKDNKTNFHDNIYETKDNNKDEKDNKDYNKKYSLNLEEKENIKDPKRLSLINPFESARKIFSSLSGYLNDNIINKININFNMNNKDKDSNDNNFVINFDKPANFGEIEKHWNYGKILLDNNILDFTSKSYKINNISI